MGKYFGTDGFRGEAGITLTADHAYKVGRFLGWYYNALRERNGNNEPARIVIGKDTRRSSYMFEYSLVAGLTASGADAYLLHVTTTPSVAYIARVDDFDCGIMISASHNPYYDNGIKLIDCYGEKMPEEILLLVEDYIDGKLHVFDKDWPELPFAHREHIGCTVDYVSGRNRYMGYLISLGIYSFKGVKVGLDCANGSCRTSQMHCPSTPSRFGSCLSPPESTSRIPQSSSGRPFIPSEKHRTTPLPSPPPCLPCSCPVPP